MSPQAEEAIVRLRGIGKSYPGVRAVDSVDIEFCSGEVHAIVGENGAGKSTLVRMLTGLEAPDSGQIEIDGHTAHLRSPGAARRAGISLVPQEAALVPTLSVGRNVLLTSTPAWVRRSRLSGVERTAVTEALTRVGAEDIDPDTPATALSTAQARLCQIAATLIRPGRLLVLDEPTAVLADADAELLLRRLDLLREAGTSILYISHRLGEVQRLADRITVLRDGVVVGTYARGELDRGDLIRLMARKQDEADEPRQSPMVVPAASPALDGPVLMRVRGLAREGAFAGIDFDARAGEVVGIAGIQGSGHGRLLEAIAGATTVEAGTIEVDGVRVEPGSLRSALQAGVRLVPEERRERGIVGPLSIRDNLSIGFDSDPQRRFVRDGRAERAAAATAFTALDIRAASADVATSTLSGGNQQKVVIARVLASRPRVMLLAEPTQGIDVRAKAEILGLLRRFARERGIAVVLASSEFEELLDFADTIHVLRLGRLVASMPAATASYTAVLEAAVP